MEGASGGLTLLNRGVHQALRGIDSLGGTVYTCALCHPATMSGLRLCAACHGLHRNGSSVPQAGTENAATLPDVYLLPHGDGICASLTTKKSRDGAAIGARTHAHRHTHDPPPDTQTQTNTHNGTYPLLLASTCFYMRLHTSGPRPSSYCKTRSEARSADKPQQLLPKGCIDCNVNTTQLPPIAAALALHTECHQHFAIPRESTRMRLTTKPDCLTGRLGHAGLKSGQVAMSALNSSLHQSWSFNRQFHQCAFVVTTGGKGGRDMRGNLRLLGTSGHCQPATVIWEKINGCAKSPGLRGILKETEGYVKPQHIGGSLRANDGPCENQPHFASSGQNRGSITVPAFMHTSARTRRRRWTNWQTDAQDFVTTRTTRLSRVSDTRGRVCLDEGARSSVLANACCGGATFLESWSLCILFV